MSSSVMQLVERKLHLLDLEGEAESMAQSTADTFTVLDRRELMRQGLQNEQLLRDMGELNVKVSGTIEGFEKRIRALEDDRLKLRTEIATAAATSKLWIGVISTLAAAGVSLLMKVLWK